MVVRTVNDIALQGPLKGVRNFPDNFTAREYFFRHVEK